MRAPRVLSRLLPHAVAVFLCWIPSRVAAQPVSPVVRLLMTSTDPRERAQAALTLGTLPTRGAREALEHALSDESAAVRTSAASSLGILGDSAALAALRPHAHDPDENVRGAVGRTITALEVAPDWAHAHFVVWPGQIVDRTGNDPARIEAVRTGIAHALRGHPDIALRLGAYPPGIEARVRRGQLKAYSLDGGLSQLARTEVGGSTSIRATVSLVLVLEPVHAIMGSLEGNASAHVSPSQIATPQAAASIEGRIVESAVGGALQNLESTLASIRR